MMRVTWQSYPKICQNICREVVLLVATQHTQIVRQAVTHLMISDFIQYFRKTQCLVHLVFLRLGGVKYEIKAKTEKYMIKALTHSPVFIWE